MKCTLGDNENICDDVRCPRGVSGGIEFYFIKMFAAVGKI